MFDSITIARLLRVTPLVGVSLPIATPSIEAQSKLLKRCCAILAGLLLLMIPLSLQAQEGFWINGHIAVAIEPLPDEGYIKIARRVMKNPEQYQSIINYNNNRPIMKGKKVRFPLKSLQPHIQGQVLRSMYPDDELTEKGLAHHIVHPLETLIQITEAYTGTKSNYQNLANFNKIKNPERLLLGSAIYIPLSMIPEGLGFHPASTNPQLQILTNAQSGQSYAKYKVKSGETLYSILLRFTDRERAVELRRMANEVLAINKIKSAKRVQAGQDILFPALWLESSYISVKPAPQPQQIAPDNPQISAKGLHVIIDPGHGGIDPGAVYKQGKAEIYEHEVVYDIALRLEKLLKQNGISSYMTIGDPLQKSPVKNITARSFGREFVKVHPPYIIDSNEIGVNMRVYLINALVADLVKSGVPQENIIMISIHGDALAHTLRGSMVYYPDHRLRLLEFNPHKNVYLRRQEYAKATLFLPHSFLRSSSAASQDLAKLIIESMKKTGLTNTHRKPVRPYYYRNGERTLPAVLRYSKAYRSVLVEIANLNNQQDLKIVMNSNIRQKIAHSIAEVMYYYNRKTKQKSAQSQPLSKISKDS